MPAPIRAPQAPSRRLPGSEQPGEDPGHDVRVPVGSSALARPAGRCGTVGRARRQQLREPGVLAGL